MLPGRKKKKISEAYVMHSLLRQAFNNFKCLGKDLKNGAFDFHFYRNILVNRVCTEREIMLQIHFFFFYSGKSIETAINGRKALEPGFWNSYIIHYILV